MIDHNGDVQEERRRSPGRRAEDLRRARESRRRARVIQVLIRAALLCLLLWAIVSTVAAVGFSIQGSHNTTALHRATHALDRANTALVRSNVALRGVEIALTSLHRQVVESCVRQNIGTARENKSHAADYGVFNFVQRITKPSPTESRRQRRITNKFAERLVAAVRAKSWVPLTNCALAVAVSGSDYRPAEPIPFTEKAPPASALSIANASLTDPVGSVP